MTVLDKLRKLRADHLRIQHDIVFYPYQEQVSDKILEALIQNLRLTAGATEEDVKKLKLVEIPVEFSRQSGKTTAIVYTVEFILTWLSVYFNRQINIAIFAPQIEQAKTDFDRLKIALRRIKQMIVVNEQQAREIKEEENSRTLVLPDGSSCYIAPVTKTSRPESKTLDLMIFEESQDLDDQIVKESIFPIGASTNAPRVFIGTAGTRICYFRNLGQEAGALKLYFEDIVAQRRDLYNQTGDAKHLIYEQTVRQEIEKHGIDSDEIQRPYFGKWLIGTGQFTTQEELFAIETDRTITPRETHSMSFAGIDTAKHPDSTVVTIIRYNEELKKKELINWLELRGENYQNQFDIINSFLGNYNVLAIAVDSTGQGDFMPDMFEKHSQYQDENSGLYRVKFSAVSKDQMYKNLKVSIKEFLTTLPKLDTKKGSKFKQQMLDLQQEYKGQLLSVHHPDDANAHDDYCLVAGTYITTDNGDVEIQDIKVGDKVLTRDGYKSVIKIGNRKAKVISRYGFTGTPDHPFITQDGIKPLQDLQLSDKIYMWNEKQSSIEVKSITDTLSLNADNSECITGDMINGKNHQYHYIDKNTLMSKGIFLKVGLYTILTKIHSIMTYQTLKLCLEAYINPNMPQVQNELKEQKRLLRLHRKKRRNGTLVKKAERGTKNTLTTVSSNTSNLVLDQDVDSGLHKTVFNIQVEDAHEYFANNILVHNCDSWALAEWAYARFNENQVEAETVTVDTAEERDIQRDSKGNITDYWV